MWPQEQFQLVLESLKVGSERVAAGTMSAVAYAELEQVVGITYNPDGLLASRAIFEVADIVGACTYDWVHNMLQVFVASGLRSHTHTHTHTLV